MVKVISIINLTIQNLSFIKLLCRKYELSKVFIVISLLFISLPLFSAQNKTLLINGDNNFPPYEFINDNGEVDGFNVDVLKAVLEVQGIKYDIKLAPWNEVRSALENAKIDLLSGMFYSEARAKLVEFSDPFIKVTHTAFFRNGEDVYSPEDITKDKVIIVQKGDIMHDYAKKHYTANKVVPMVDPESALRRLASGKDENAVVLIGRYQGMYLLEKFKLNNVLPADFTLHTSDYCFASYLGNREVAYTLNEGLDIITATGAYKEIREKWFGRYEPITRDYFEILLAILAVSLVLFAIISVWIFTLKKMVNIKTKELNENYEAIKKMKDELQISRDRYKSIITVSNTGVWEYNIDEKNLWCSSEYYQMLGYDDNDFTRGKAIDIQTSWIDLLHPEDRDKASNHFKKYFESGSTKMYENIFRMKHKRGDWLWIYSRGQIMKRSDGTLSNLVLGAHTNITDIKEAEQIIAEKNKELEQIVYVSSHDLRSPLVNVDGYSRELEYSINEFESALEGKKNIEDVLKTELPEMVDALKHIRNSTKQMDSLLNGLLKLSRSGRAALNITVLDMNDVISRVMSGMEFLVGETGSEVKISELPPCRGDEVQITQVFNNLIGNALKFLDDNRKGVIKISGVVEKGHSVYCIEDNGIGIREEHQDKIFEIFHRLYPSDTTGEGLGLPIVRQIVSRLDGKVYVESKAGKGSKFYVSLPYSELEGKK